MQARTLAHESGAGWVAATAAAVVLGCGGLRAFNLAGAEERFLGSVAGTVLASSGALLAAAAAPRLVSGGAAPGWPRLLAARGVPAWLWVAASAGALLLALAWMAAAVGLAFGVAAARLGFDGWAAGWGLVRTQAGPLAVVAGAALASAAVFRRPLPATAATLALALAGHLAPALDWAMARQDGAFAVLGSVALRLVPDLASAPGPALDIMRGLQALGFVVAAAWVLDGRED